MRLSSKSLLPRVVGGTVLAATYVAAAAMTQSTHPAVRVGGWTFFFGKVSMLLVTVLSVGLHPSCGWKIFVGRYCFDDGGTWLALAQAVTRFGWELPQMWVGYMLAQGRNLLGRVDRAERLRGVTYAIKECTGGTSDMGISIGCWVGIWTPRSLAGDFEAYAKSGRGRILLHEFGHCADSMMWGWLYLLVVGLPSLLSQAIDAATGGRWHRHSHLYAERWANRHAQHLFGVRMGE